MRLCPTLQSGVWVVWGDLIDGGLDDLILSCFIIFHAYNKQVITKLGYVAVSKKKTDIKKTLIKLIFFAIVYCIILGKIFCFQMT